MRSGDSSKAKTETLHMKHDGLRWLYFVHRVVNNVTKSLEISSWSPDPAAAILNMNQKYLKPICLLCEPVSGQAGLVTGHTWDTHG